MGKGKPAQRKELAFSVTRKDLVIQTFTAGGPGGQHQNTSNTAVRIIHPASGAAGEARDSRSQHQNMRAALKRMAESGKFRSWVNLQLLGNPLPPEEQVERDMAPHNLLIMGRQNGRWKVIP
jgi:peptide chain release factor 1